MKEFKRININTRLSSNPFLIFLIWFFLIILPYLGLTVSIKYLLEQSEKRIVSKAKIQLIDEVNELKNKLTYSYYIESKLSEFPNKDLQKDELNALKLSKAIENQTETKVLALYYYNTSKNYCDYYVSNEEDNDLKIRSKYSLKNLLLAYSSKNEKNQNKDRSIIYLETFLHAAGGINLMPENAIPILSGKPNLGKIVAYYKSFDYNSSTNKQMFLCLFKVKDISLKKIAKHAILKSNKTFNHKLLFSKNKKSIETISDKLDPIFFRYQLVEKEGLSIYSKTSEEMLLRLGTLDTYYPLYLKELLEKEPIIKITIPNDKLEHPMRSIIKRLRFPTLLLLLLATFGLLKIGIYGYVANIHILGRVIICVLAAVLLPFASFFIASFYNQYFEEEYSEYEIQTYTRMQTEVINKAIEAYISNRELEVSKLRNEINGLSAEKLNEKLNNWIKTSGANLISYNYLGGKENIIKAEPNDALLALGINAKKLFDDTVGNFFSETVLSKIEDPSDLEGIYHFQPHSISTVMSNIGEIHTSIPNEPNSLYSLFPIYGNTLHEDKIKGSVLVKFENKKILKSIKTQMPELFEQKVMGDYIIRNAVVPVKRNGDLSESNDMIMTNNMNISNIMPKLEQILSERSQKTWKKDNTINTGTYLSRINAIAISSAEKNKQDNISNKINLKNIGIYIIIMILTLSIILSGLIVAPIRILQKGAERIAEGDYSNKISWNSGDEFENLCNGFNSMTDALLQKEKMSSYVSKEVINEVSSNIEQQLQPSGERIPVAVLFCALKSKKELNEYTPDEVTEIIGNMIDAVDEISTKYNGQIDKLIEDTVMVVFRKVCNEENIVLNACKTALEINKRLKNELPDFKIYMGIGSGDAVSGKIGSRSGKLDYTVIGNPVNLAARLKVQAHKATHTGILVCPYSIRQLHGAGRLNFIERMSIKGRTNRTFPLYELLSIRNS